VRISAKPLSPSMFTVPVPSNLSTLQPSGNHERGMQSSVQGLSSAVHAVLSQTFSKKSVVFKFVFHVNKTAA